MAQKYPHQSLNFGDVINAAFCIYKDNFQLYFKMAFVGCLWIFIPVYGWAKFAATLGAIARLAFFEVSEQPESPRYAERYTDYRKWYFLGQLSLLALIIFGAFIGCIIVFSLAGFITGFMGAILFGPESSLSFLLILLLGLVAFIISYIGLMWISSRVYICDVILAVEKRMNASESIIKSWKITEDSAFKIVMILIVAGLAILPVGIGGQLVIAIGRLFVSLILPYEAAFWVNILIVLAVSIVTNALTLPFFQSITAVIYYDIIGSNGKQNLVEDSPKT